MKIEKLSDNQIRCTLTRADLARTSAPTQRTGLWYRKSEITFPRYDATGSTGIWF